MNNGAGQFFFLQPGPHEPALRTRKRTLRILLVFLVLVNQYDKNGGTHPMTISPKRHRPMTGRGSRPHKAPGEAIPIAKSPRAHPARNGRIRADLRPVDHLEDPAHLRLRHVRVKNSRIDPGTRGLLPERSRTTPGDRPRRRDHDRALDPFPARDVEILPGHAVHAGRDRPRGQTAGGRGDDRLPCRSGGEGAGRGSSPLPVMISLSVVRRFPRPLFSG